QWGRFGRGFVASDKVSQPAFAPDSLKDETRPNLFSRAFSFAEIAKGVDKKSNTGLEEPDTYTNSNDQNAAFPKRPKHTLGFYNDLGKTGTVSYNSGTGEYTFSASTTGNNLKYSGMNPAYDAALMSPYHNAPAILDNNKFVAAPFEHLVWNDSPLSNPAEIMLVPASAPGRFGVEFIRNPKGNPGTKTMTYDLTQLYRNGVAGSGTSLGTSAAAGMTKGTMFGYDFEAYAKRAASKSEDEHNKMGAYLNFFNSSATTGGSLNLASFLDFIRVPSPVLGTKVARGDELLPPYTTRHLAGKDMVDTMREPGKININTMGPASWSGIAADAAGAKQSLYAQFTNVDSNRALLFFQNQTSGVLNRFVNTTLDHNVLVPMLNAASSSTTDTLRMFRPSNYSLMRRPLDLNTFTTDTSKLEADADGTAPGGGTGSSIASNPLFDSGGTTALRGDLYAATAELQRLSNLTTTRSNVFAAWITTGYFEVEPVNPGENMPKYDPDGNEITREKLANAAYKYYYYYKAIYPDGCTYGKELGLEDGKTKRHRSFFLIDRSIPVDFRRGQSLNWKDAVLLHRQIE
ncbi:MAG: hypothetical protein Q4G59_03390, partial [Planctomycetia bacterium]|nr:hypothetical protein [Planctomycetia bacterium]